LEAAKFCRKCGDDLNKQQLVVGGPPVGRGDGAEEETRVAVRETVDAARLDVEAVQENADGADEATIFSISPTLMFVNGGYVLACVGALVIVAITSSFLSQYVSVWEAVLIGLLLFLVPAFYHFKQKLVRYTLTDSKLEIDEGFISRTTRNVPIRRIQDVTVATTALQRILGFGNLVIDNASEEGGKVLLKNINTPKHYAELLLKQMRRLDQ
jgi:membrane protein YdbS with pleckstrin-like domain